MFCKIGVLKNFVKFTGKHLCQSLVLNKVAGWKLFQNARESTFAGASFLIKLQAEKFFKIHRKTPVGIFALNKMAGYIFFEISQENNSRSLFFNKDQHQISININIKLLICLHFFITPLITKSELSAPLTQCVLIHSWRVP